MLIGSANLSVCRWKEIKHTLSSTHRHQASVSFLPIALKQVRAHLKIKHLKHSLSLSALDCSPICVAAEGKEGQVTVGRPLWNHPHSYPVPNCRTDRLQEGLNTIVDWNTLPEDMATAPILKSFQSRLSSLPH